MTPAQLAALEHPCYLAGETIHMAMRARAEEMRTGRRAGAREGEP